MAEWEESKHPRDDDGKFTSGGGTPAEHKRLKELGIEHSTKDNISSILGKEYKGYKGQQAINKLLSEKQGYIKEAFRRDDIGAIDLIWGDENVGLKHIINQREKQNIDTKLFLDSIAETIEKGSFRKKNDRGNFEFMHNGKIAIISPELRGHKMQFLLTAFKTHSKK